MINALLTAITSVFEHFSQVTNRVEIDCGIRLLRHADVIAVAEEDGDCDEEGDRTVAAMDSFSSEVHTRFLGRYDSQRRH